MVKKQGEKRGEMVKKQGEKREEMVEKKGEKREEMVEIQGRETVGTIALELQAKDQGKVTPNEQAIEHLGKYQSGLSDCVKEHEKLFGVQTDFFVNVITKKEPLLQNVLRNYFVGRKSCPSPDYDQAIYHFHGKTGDLELIWVVPSRDTCYFMLDNALTLPPDQKALLGYVIEFRDGTLFKLMKKLNGEKLETPELKHT